MFDLLIKQGFSGYRTHGERLSFGDFPKLCLAFSLRMISTSPPDPLSAFERRSMTRRLMRKGGKRL